MRNPKSSHDPVAPVRFELSAKDSSIDASRRRFLFTLGAGGAGAAGAATGAAAAAAQVAPDTTAADDAQYRETEHVRDYYRSAKI